MCGIFLLEWLKIVAAQLAVQCREPRSRSSRLLLVVRVGFRVLVARTGGECAGVRRFAGARLITDADVAAIVASGL